MRAQSSKRGFKFAMSGACRKASLLSGLKRPDAFKLFSTTIDISDPIFFFLIFFQNLFLIDHQ